MAFLITLVIEGGSVEVVRDARSHSHDEPNTGHVRRAYGKLGFEIHPHGVHGAKGPEWPLTALWYVADHKNGNRAVSALRQAPVRRATRKRG